MLASLRCEKLQFLEMHRSYVESIDVVFRAAPSLEELNMVHCTVGTWQGSLTSISLRTLTTRSCLTESSDACVFELLTRLFLANSLRIRRFCPSGPQNLSNFALAEHWLSSNL